MTTRYPADRINSFSDAIFAVAITFLILEIKVPSSEKILELGMGPALKTLIPSGIGFLVSFFVTALYWRAHLSLTEYITSYSSRLLWLTLLLLLFVVIMPFSTALYSQNFNHNYAFFLYALNLFMIGLFNFLMVRATILLETKNENLTRLMAKRLTFRAIIAPSVWLLSAISVFTFPILARLMFFSIFVIQAIGERRINAMHQKIG